ncbi:hypothetical protein EYB53_020465 [Candidatus Chloroploca sp. M-50]|uniref:Uncharacterized protein n=1 Tax=Candidatus Chloroploca mongolica TaxID=2528176 RepID=A0ABS4DF73_9CHLR|nr:hypothetical protein [Candidatus Chloroploca mongolica]MBP1468099.1 hypothetical protein [Candidatus Chloroploca mongolica]
MPIDAVTEEAGKGMSLAIYKEIDRLLTPPLFDAVKQASGDVKAQETLDQAREGWKDLSSAIAAGVVNYITDHMKIVGVQIQVDGHLCIQSDDGTEHIGWNI